MPGFDDAVELTADLPDVVIGTSYGTPALKARKALFARMWSDREHRRDGVDDTEVLVLFCDLDEKDVLLATYPDVLFSTDHYEGHGAFLVRLSEVDRELLGDLLEDSYRCKAPPTLLRRLDES